MSRFQAHCDRPVFRRNHSQMNFDLKASFDANIQGTGDDESHLVESIQNMIQVDITSIIDILGEYGARAMVSMFRLSIKCTSYFNGSFDLLPRLQAMGGPKCFSHFASDWAVADEMPLIWTNQMAPIYSGALSGMITLLPKRIQAMDEPPFQSRGAECWVHSRSGRVTLLAVACCLTAEVK